MRAACEQAEVSDAPDEGRPAGARRRRHHHRRPRRPRGQARRRRDDVALASVGIRHRRQAGPQDAPSRPAASDGEALDAAARAGTAKIAAKVGSPRPRPTKVLAAPGPLRRRTATLPDDVDDVEDIAVEPDAEEIVEDAELDIEDIEEPPRPPSRSSAEAEAVEARGRGSGAARPSRPPRRRTRSSSPTTTTTRPRSRSRRPARRPTRSRTT